MEHEYIIAHADKSVLKISGLEVKGLNTKQLEKMFMILSLNRYEKTKKAL